MRSFFLEDIHGGILGIIALYDITFCKGEIHLFLSHFDVFVLEIRICGFCIYIENLGFCYGFAIAYAADHADYGKNKRIFYDMGSDFIKRTCEKVLCFCARFGNGVLPVRVQRVR